MAIVVLVVVVMAAVAVELPGVFIKRRLLAAGKTINFIVLLILGNNARLTFYCDFGFHF